MSITGQPGGTGGKKESFFVYKLKRLKLILDSQVTCRGGHHVTQISITATYLPLITPRL